MAAAASSTLCRRSKESHGTRICGRPPGGDMGRRDTHRLPSRAADPALALAVLVVIPLLGGKVSEAFSPLDPRSKWLTFSVTASRWLNDHTPLGSVLAMGDRAGALAYLTDRPIVQREGIVNSSPDLAASGLM